MNSSDKLSRIQSYASIFASIAVPLLVALFGWALQSKTSEDSVKKDYVQIAIKILNTDKEKADEDMRQWAIAVLDKNSPVPFSKDMKDSLQNGKTVFIKSSFKLPPAIFMEPPYPLKELQPNEKGIVTNGDLLTTITENYSLCNQNSARLEGLQNLLREFDKIYNPPDGISK
ncbi:hypothetical protein [Pseudomonas orientalis]|uniref:hypothetical protein n=1 Tax=Pseudomonas orientalis TaxID=76758 RepID=UPI000F58EB06|nr:hypothetical protein [Pseudomonas orientalis]